MDLTQSTARNRVFSFVGVSLTTLSVTVSKDGGAFGSPGGALTQITGNFYKLALTTGDTDTLGDLYYKFSDSVIGIVVPNGSVSDQIITGAVALTSAERTTLAGAILDLANGVETSLTLRQAMRLIAAANAGKLSGAATTTVVVRNAVGDSKDRITATVDSNGNRSAVVLDLT